MPRKGCFLLNNMLKQQVISDRPFLVKAAGLMLSLSISLNTIPVAIAKELNPLTGIEAHISQTSLEASTSATLKGYKIFTTVTGYSSTADQTDDSPFTTASNKHVTDGFVAANFLPFGTHIQIPKLFGNKVFTVEDRMHERFNDRIDVWFPDRATALKFGKRSVEVIVL